MRVLAKIGKQDTYIIKAIINGDIIFLSVNIILDTLTYYNKICRNLLHIIFKVKQTIFSWYLRKFSY